MSKDPSHVLFWSRSEECILWFPKMQISDTYCVMPTFLVLCGALSSRLTHAKQLDFCTSTNIDNVLMLYKCMPFLPLIFINLH